MIVKHGINEVLLNMGHGSEKVNFGFSIPSNRTEEIQRMLKPFFTLC